MEFGVFHEFSRRPAQSEAEAFAESFELVDAAERWGLDVLWLAELHFTTSSVLASPLAIAAAIAGRTERLRIGTAVQVLPLGDPLRLAEEWATVDQISRGRLIFGVGRSGFARAYLSYGIPYEQSRERFAEALEIIRLAWTEPTFSYHGTYRRYDNVALSPKPFQQPHPPIRVAAVTPDTFPMLGTQGYPIFAAVRQGTVSELRSDIARYRAAFRAAGRDGDGEVYLRIPIYVAASAEQAIAEPEESIMRFFWEMGAQLLESATQAGARDSDQRVERGHALANLSYEQARREKVIVGTPDVVTRRLQEIRDELGIQGILAELNCGRQIPDERVMRSLRLLCQEVMPSFR
jgi:alkanesulfonate monooxygenase SsuD/methylene tetrahydromethanopterin reductase-like flavin-dependent oxidoreductase (luciferase family)